MNPHKVEEILGVTEAEVREQAHLLCCQPSMEVAPPAIQHALPAPPVRGLPQLSEETSRAFKPEPFGTFTAGANNAIVLGLVLCFD